MVHVVQGAPGRRTLADSHHVARYCRPRHIGSDGQPVPAAFLLRSGEMCLSTNWLERFHNYDRQTQIAGVRQALTDQGFRVSRTGAFAVLNVGAAVNACKTALNLDITIIALGESRDPSHAGTYGYTEHDVNAADLSAKSVNADEIYPAAA